MRILPAFIATLILSATLALPASAADKPITVQIDQQKIDLKGYNPVRQNNTMLVPLRPLFEALGLKIGWNPATGQITGTKEGFSIQLQIGKNTAVVNGQTKKLAVAPQMIRGAAYVPLRFVGEAAGVEVGWNPKASLISVTSKPAVDTSGITKLFEQYVEYSNKENYTGLMGLLDPASTLAAAGESIEAQMEQYDLSVKLEQLDIVSVEQKEAVVRTVETTTRLGGLFMPDSLTEYYYTVVKADNANVWKISGVQINAVKYSVPEKVLNASPSVPKETEKAVMAELELNHKNSNEENIDGLLSALTPGTAEYEQNKQILSQLFQTYDLAFTLESAKIIDYTDSRIAVYVVQTTKKLKGPEFQNNRASSVMMFDKAADGSWKIGVSYLISSENL
ncbi:copper amine oxidase N-terminal domain-containing protein ['Paenibacillus yunnanensis' Narsing Rao et al. 2020]|uniref:copper amine oxidase N-terminal domain-containing protein n=1 Tax=Paenibacillus tengchongensis TaxID=2608684 RepID=UPI00124C42E1|nr:copper amine oxidase N-terminal domain-containing protein [Paenibacillus tengchongensis]